MTLLITSSLGDWWYVGGKQGGSGSMYLNLGVADLVQIRG